MAEHLNRLGISEEYQIRIEKVYRNGQQATKVFVDLLMPPTAPVCSATDTHESTTGQYHSHVHSATECVTSATDGAWHSHAQDDHPHDHHHPDSPIHTQDAFHSSTPPLPHPPTPHSHPTPPHLPHSHFPQRNLPQIEQLIRAAQLPKWVEIWSLAIFHQLAEAEAAVHGIPPEQVHFHEVGATDAIIDIVGTCLGLDWLGIERIYCSPLPVGGGVVRAAHGTLPVPTPAVLKLFELRQVPLYSNGIERELVTPTGAAIATTLATQFGSPPAMTLYRVGLGAGSHNLPLPNILRLWVGEKCSGEIGSAVNSQQLAVNSRQSAVNSRQSAVSSQQLALSSQQSAEETPHPLPLEPISILETQIDDLSPQAIGYVFDALFQAGAVDVFTQAIAMKKSRPGILLTVICHPDAVSACETVLFRETTTLGIRHSVQQRHILQREIQSVQTEYGPIRIKIAWAEGNFLAETLPNLTPITVQPEYDDCAQIARQHHLPWREVHRLALEAWYRSKP
jgi:uncharacterized protein (TIGR00299 family) protein